MIRLRAPAAALALALASASPGEAQPVRAERVAGEWSGEGFQVGPTGYQSHWTVEIELAGRGGAIAYPSLGCTGALTLVRGSARSERAEYAERITSGACLDGGRVVVEARAGRLFWFWYAPPGSEGVGSDASAVLYPAGLIS